MVVVRAKMNDLRGAYIGQPNGSVYGSPDSRVHAGRRQTFETLIPNDNISSRLPDCRVVWLVPERTHRQDVESPAGLFTLWYATWTRPQAQPACNSPYEFLDLFDLAQVTRRAYLYVPLLRTTIILFPSKARNIRPNSGCGGSHPEPVLSGYYLHLLCDAFANARYLSFCVSQT
jgi:hypothetical protein